MHKRKQEKARHQLDNWISVRTGDVACSVASAGDSYASVKSPYRYIIRGHRARPASLGSYIPETDSWASRGTSPAVEAGDLPGANFRETPLSESEQSMRAGNVGKRWATYPANLCRIHCGGATSHSVPRTTILHSEG